MTDNPYESPVAEQTEPKVGKFRHAFQVGIALVGIILAGLAGIVVGILALIVGAVVALLKAIFTKQTFVFVTTLALQGLVVWFLWSYAACAAFPYFVELSYLQSVGLVILTTILFKTYVPPTPEKKDGLAELLALSAYLDKARASRAAAGPGRAAQGSPAGNDSQCSGPACGPQRSVPEASRR